MRMKIKGGKDWLKSSKGGATVVEDSWAATPVSDGPDVKQKRLSLTSFNVAAPHNYRRWRNQAAVTWSPGPVAPLTPFEGWTEQKNNLLLPSGFARAMSVRTHLVFPSHEATCLCSLSILMRAVSSNKATPPQITSFKTLSARAHSPMVLADNQDSVTPAVGRGQRATLSSGRCCRHAE